MDNDGYRDIYVTNGINHDLTDLDFVDFFANEIIQDMALTGKKEAIDSIIDKMPVYPLPNYAFHNQKDLTFDNKAQDWGLGVPSLSNGAAYGDLDNDGDLDLVVNNVNMQAFVYQNNTDQIDQNNFIKLKLEGLKQNKYAVGSSVKLFIGDQQIVQELQPSRGFQSSMDYTMTMGLGTHSTIDSLEVLWPNDTRTLLRNIDVNRELTLSQVQANVTQTEITQTESTKKSLLSVVDNPKLIAHQENPSNDFDYEGLLGKLISQEGPCMAVGDLNGDGHQDVFLGGAKGQSGQVLMHLGDGELNPQYIDDLSKDASFEDTAAALADIDQDGDLDLLIGSGGNQVDEASRESLRLYLNDGRGRFTKNTIIALSNINNISAIAPHDVDGDGDLDLVVTSRSIVGVYGMQPKQFFLENTGQGAFVDRTQDKAIVLQEAGMVTAAQWVQLDQGFVLVTVSDWGAPHLYHWHDNKFQHRSSSLDELTGWWNTMASADIDSDGDMDLILGNQGGNIHYKPAKDAPMRLWVNDFDNNGTYEQIISQNLEGRDMPVHQKKEMTTQLVSLKKQNLKASEYAKKSIQELFAPSVLKNTTILEARYANSVIAYNQGDGVFTFEDLPARSQLSCICGIACVDVNQDGALDIIAGGNNHEFRPQFSRLDSNYGNVLINDGAQNFDWQNYAESGFYIRDEIKHIKPFNDASGKTYIFVAINDRRPMVYSLP
jgi:hypothetical protein